MSRNAENSSSASATHVDVDGGIKSVTPLMFLSDDQFEIQEVAIHDGEWKDTTFSVSAATMDAVSYPSFVNHFTYYHISVIKRKVISH